MIGGLFILFLYITRIASNEIFSPSNKINREVGRAKDLSAPWYLFIIMIGGILVLFIYITRLALNEIFSPSNKIHWEVGRAKELSAPWYLFIIIIYYHDWRNISTIYIYITRLRRKAY
jgi:hypothetical protein